MLREIELHFGGDDPHMELHTVDVSCGTELANVAREMQMKAGFRVIKHKSRTGREKTRIVGLLVDNVSFGPVIQRFKDGSPAFGKDRDLDKIL